MVFIEIFPEAKYVYYELYDEAKFMVRMYCGVFKKSSI